MTKTSNKKNTFSKLPPLLLLITNSALVVGCSMFSVEQEVGSKSDFEQKLERYTKLEPEIQRVLALESDMQVIVSELSKYSTLGTDPLGKTPLENTMPSDSNNAQNVKDKSSIDTKSFSVIKTSNCSAKSNVEYGHCSMKFGLHIAAFSDEKYVLPGWIYLKKQLPAALTKDKLPLSMEVVQEDIAYQSLRIGPFTSAYQAKRVCDEAGHIVACAVVEYQGKKVDG